MVSSGPEKAASGCSGQEQAGPGQGDRLASCRHYAQERGQRLRQATAAAANRRGDAGGRKENRSRTWQLSRREL